MKLIRYAIRMSKLEKEEVLALLKNASLRITLHRVAIIEVIAKAKMPITVDTLFTILRKKYDIDQATVYRNVSQLLASSLIRRLDFNHGHAHYELEQGKISAMFICSRCEIKEKIDAKLFTPVLRLAKAKSRKCKQFTTQSMEVYGLCRGCK